MGRVLAMVIAPPTTTPTAGSVALHADGSHATRQTLAAVRQQEDRRAWQVLGRLSDRHEWLGYPDGRPAEAPDAELVRTLGHERPDVAVTFGPEEITGTLTTSNQHLTEILQDLERRVEHATVQEHHRKAV